MTSKAYRARFRGYRNCGLAMTGVAAGTFYLATLADSAWFYLFAILTAFFGFLGPTYLVGYYLTGFSE